MDGARPHSVEAMTNRMTLSVNSRTAPKRCVSQPVSGTEMALATPKLVMTQVPCEMLTPRSPEIDGRDTFAIDESSTFMKVASDNDSVPSTSALPVRGAGGLAAAAGADMEDLLLFWPMRGRRRRRRRLRGRGRRHAAAAVGRDDARHFGVGVVLQRVEHRRRGDGALRA